MSSLKNKLNEYIKEHSLNPTSFSRKADISPGIITNIMATENANPTIDTALKIAKIMNCSLDELFDKNYLAGSKIIIPELLQSICDNLCSIPEMQNRTLNDFCSIIKYIYDYCEENKLQQADQNFIKWYITKIYNR